MVWSRKEIHIERTWFFESTVSKEEEFYKQALMPELLGKWFPKMPVMSPVISNDIPTMVNIPQDNSLLKDV